VIASTLDAISIARADGAVTAMAMAASVVFKVCAAQGCPVSVVDAIASCRRAPLR
jgi:hypothetical protein